MQMTEIWRGNGTASEDEYFFLKSLQVRKTDWETWPSTELFAAEDLRCWCLRGSSMVQL